MHIFIVLVLIIVLPVGLALLMANLIEPLDER